MIFHSLKRIPHSKNQNSISDISAGWGRGQILLCRLHRRGHPAFRDYVPWLCGSQCLRGAAGSQVTFQKGQGIVGRAVVSFSRPPCGPWASHPPSVGLSFPFLPSKPSLIQISLRSHPAPSPSPGIAEL